MAQHNGAAFCGCTIVPADSAESAHIWQNLSKTFSGDCCAVSGNDEETGFISGYNTGIHYWEIVSSVVEAGAADDPPSFAVGVVTGDRKPGKIFLGSEPASGILGVGFGYLGSRAQVMSTGFEPRSYGVTFAAGDTIGVLFQCTPGAEQLRFFVNGVDQGVAFSSKDFRSKAMMRIRTGAEGRDSWRPAVGMSKAGVQVSICHRSATALIAASVLTSGALSR